MGSTVFINICLHLQICFIIWTHRIEKTFNSVWTFLRDFTMIIHVARANHVLFNWINILHSSKKTSWDGIDCSTTYENISCLFMQQYLTTSHLDILNYYWMIFILPPCMWNYAEIFWLLDVEHGITMNIVYFRRRRLM